MLATSLWRANTHAQVAAWSAVVLLSAATGCGTAAYEERLDATVTSLRAGPQTPAPAEAAEPPAAPAAEAMPDQEAAAAADAANAAGQGGVVGRTILAPTDALP